MRHGQARSAEGRATQSARPGLLGTPGLVVLSPPQSSGVFVAQRRLLLGAKMMLVAGSQGIGFNLQVLTAAFPIPSQPRPAPLASILLHGPGPVRRGGAVSSSSQPRRALARGWQTDGKGLACDHHWSPDRGNGGRRHIASGLAFALAIPFCARSRRSPPKSASLNIQPCRLSCLLLRLRGRMTRSGLPWANPPIARWCRREELKMNTQSGQSGRGGLLNNLWLQLALIVIGTVVLIAFAAKYLW